ncbi:hypothetical protein SBA3_1740017 [Candidatus Sulfopaludibacter sp. SbA3]|nr:hypothetical protein SBA3_1740017 [Candidatus Sulfopaludibacter sp. SbA3]
MCVRPCALQTSATFILSGATGEILYLAVQVEFHAAFCSNMRVAHLWWQQENSNAPGYACPHRCFRQLRRRPGFHRDLETQPCQE